jgi:hypothetical protein
VPFFPLDGPRDFSTLISRADAIDLYEEGRLEPLFLLPPEFGGKEQAENVVLVPTGTAAMKDRIDLEMVLPLVKSGRAKRYRAIPSYQGKSVIPTSIAVSATDPGDFSSTINIWGSALREAER